MRTKQATYLDFLGTPKCQMAIPVFQRVYTWGVWQCDELWEDILKAGARNKSHFIGSIVYTKENVSEGDSVRGVRGPGSDTPEGASTSAQDQAHQYGIEGVEQLYNIVDGQQRTTTMNLLMIAMRDYMRESGKTAAGKTACDIEREFLYIENGADRIQKFIAAPADKDTLAAVLNKTDMPADYLISKCVVDNYAFFKENLPKVDLDQVWLGLQNLFAIICQLGHGDNPQLIFEGINSKGMSLATSDLLRNRMFFEQDPVTQERLLKKYWIPLESLFDNDPNQNHFSAALRRWLVEKDETLAKHTRWELYSVFRKYIDEHYPTDKTEELMIELLASCEDFKHMMKSPPMKKHLDWAEGHTKIDNGSSTALFG